jgi:hypothetical protein
MSHVGWYTWWEWRVLVRTIGFISNLVTTSLNYFQYCDIADLHFIIHCYAHTCPLLVMHLKHRRPTSCILLYSWFQFALFACFCRYYLSRNYPQLNPLTPSSNSLWTYGSQLSLYSRSTDRIGNVLMTQTAQKTCHVISRQSVGALTVA